MNAYKVQHKNTVLTGLTSEKPDRYSGNYGRPKYTQNASSNKNAQRHVKLTKICSTCISDNSSDNVKYFAKIIINFYEKFMKFITKQEACEK